MSSEGDLILGIDPGLRVTGYGLVRERAGRLQTVEFGTIRSTAKLSLTERIFEIVDVLSDVLEQFQPHCASVERVFSAVNVKSALLLGHVRGAILAELRRHEIPVFEYSALEIKQSVVGYGRAEKQQVAEMCRMLLGLAEIPKPADASDALGAAICHINSRTTAVLNEGKAQ